ncbi:FAD-dependent oxidoreductase [Patescibacteria group bacterium]|nr:FAD-dependent oxidoreductase [Patescibacteria group bacterium]
MKTNYDVVVIGAGSGGLTAAVGLSKLGKSVLLVEREHLGGECTNSGCIPSKALLHHAKTYHTAVSISGTNGNTENFRRNALLYVRSKIADILKHETPEHFKDIGIDVVMGEAVFVNKNTVTVNDTTYTFKKAVIATGSSPRMIDVPGLDSDKILTNQNLFTLDTIPARTLIVGAGPIGLEMGQALAMLGSTVTILDNGPTFAKLEDMALQPIIKKSFTDLGITIIQNATLTHFDETTAIVSTRDSDTERTIPFDKVLVAIGRVPNLPQGLATAKIAVTESGIVVNQNYRTSNRRVYALGDVADKFKFTHTADNAARGVVTHITSRSLLRVKQCSVPKVTYTAPEIAQVGLSQFEAEEMFGEQSIFRIEVPFSNIDRAVTDNTTDGLLVVLVRRLSGQILGAHIVGQQAGEILAVFSVAIDNKLSLWKLRRTIYAYPTYALVIKKAGDVFFATQIKHLRSDILSILKNILPKIIVAGIWISLLLYVWQLKVDSGQTFSELSLAIFNFITGTMWGPVIYILIYTFRPIIFFPASALTILSGIFFGLWGFVYTLIGANLSAMVAHGIGQFFSVAQHKLPKILQNISGPLRTNPFMTILTMHLTFMPFDAVNYAAGIFRAPFLKHAAATLVGTILGTFTFVSIGASLDVEEFMKNGITADVIDGSFIALSAIIFIVSLVIAKRISKP